MFDVRVRNIVITLFAGCVGCGPNVHEEQGESSAEGHEPTFDSCEALLEQLHTSAPENVGNWYSSPLAAQYSNASRNGSPTDILAGSWVWDGRYAIYASTDDNGLCFDGGHNVRSACVRVIDLGSPQPEILGESPIAEVPETLQVLSNGEQLLLFASIEGSLVDEAAPDYARYTRITALRLPTLAPDGRSLVVKGQFIEARMVDGAARVTVWSKPRVSSSQQEVLERWLPTVLEPDGTESLAVECENVLATEDVSGTEMVTVLTVGMDATWQGGGTSVSVLRDAGLGNNDGAFFGGQRYGYVASAIPQEDSQRTAAARIVRLDLEATPPAYAGVVEAPATGLSAMSEYDGVLRFHGGETLTGIRSDDAFEVVGSVATPEDAGDAQSFRSPHLVAGGRIVEFSADTPPRVGSTQDPALFALQCAVGPARLAGAHALGGEPLVFAMDVSDLDAPTLTHSETVPGWDETPAGEVAGASVGGATCLPTAGLMAVPLRIDNDTQNEEGTGWDPNDKRSGFVLYDQDRESVVGELVEPTDHYVASGPEILDADGRLATVSSNGVLVAGIDALETTAWLRFPS